MKIEGAIEVKIVVECSAAGDEAGLPDDCVLHGLRKSGRSTSPMRDVPRRSCARLAGMRRRRWWPATAEGRDGLMHEIAGSCACSADTSGPGRNPS